MFNKEENGVIYLQFSTIDVSYTFDPEVKRCICILACFVKFVDYVFRMGGLYVLLYQVMEREAKQEMNQATL